MQASEVLAYAAGLIDGEGCLGIYSYGRKGFTATVTVVMTNSEAISWLHEQFKGQIYSYTASSYDERLFKWIITKRADIAKLLPGLLTYLKVKRLNAEILLSFCNRFPNPIATVNDKLEAEKYVQISSLLNSKGPGSNYTKALVTSFISHNQKE